MFPKSSESVRGCPFCDPLGMAEYAFEVIRERRSLREGFAKRQETQRRDCAPAGCAVHVNVTSPRPHVDGRAYSLHTCFSAAFCGCVLHLWFLIPV